MSYTLTLTNGLKLTDIIDGSIDQSSTDLTLVGKNVSNYGTFVNDNFVHLLENFSNDIEPAQPVVGQLWYDTSENLLKVYTGVGFAPTGNTLVSGVLPSSLNAGGLWINSTTEQLFFNDGLNTILAGPLYTADQGVSGFQVVDVLDINQINHTIVKLYVANTLLGIFSKDIEFTPVNSIAGYAGNIKAGFNVGSTSDILFDMQVASALALVDSNGVVKSTDSFMSSIDDTYANGIVSFRNNISAKFGSGDELQIEIGGSTSQIKSTAINQNLQLTTHRSGVSDYDPAVFINTASQYVGIFTDAPAATLDVNGDTIIRGNLTVEGSATTINTTNLSVEDLQIEIGKVDTPTDTTANGGGIKLKGTTDKTFTWSNSLDAWQSSENINVSGTGVYQIAGTTVLSYSALGSTVTSAPGLISIGHQTTFGAGWLSIANATVTYVNSGATNGNIVLQPKGTGSVDVDSSTIINVSTPVDGTDAANKTYVDDTVRSAPLAISLNTGTFNNGQIASNYLNVLFPYSEHANATICRAICTDSSSVVSIKHYTLDVGTTTWVYQFDY